MTRHYCTYFDHRYLPRARVLHESLLRHDPDFQLWALCMDELAFEALTALQLPQMRPIRRTEFEQGDDRLVETQASRSLIEYYFTCTPSLPLWVLSQDPQADAVTYIDADLCFVASPEPLFEEMGDASVAIVEHRFPPGREGDADHGIYNVGFLVFRRDERAATVLNWWRDRCIEWCYDRIEDGKYADQRYLDDWPSRFPGVKVLRHPGANVAPWNLGRHRITYAAGRLCSDEKALIFFHFHGIKPFVRLVFDLNLAPYGVRANRTVRRRLYRPYLRQLRRATAEVDQVIRQSPDGERLRLTANDSLRGASRYAHALRGLVGRRFLMSFGA
jgi:hypothetical protein